MICHFESDFTITVWYFLPVFFVLVVLSRLLVRLPRGGRVCSLGLHSHAVHTVFFFFYVILCNYACYYVFTFVIVCLLANEMKLLLLLFFVCFLCVWGGGCVCVL